MDPPKNDARREATPDARATDRRAVSPANGSLPLDTDDNNGNRKAAPEGVTVTVLRDARDWHGRRAPLAKRHVWQPDGSCVTSAYDKALTFRVERHTVASVGALAVLLGDLEADPFACIIRGRLRPGFDPSARHARRCHDRPNEPAAFEADPNCPWLAVDIDDLQAPEWWRWRDTPIGSAPPHEALVELAQWVRDKALPPSFAGAACVVCLSGSAGFKPWDTPRLHLWFLLDPLAENLSVKHWFKAEGAPVDRALYSPVQIHYTAAPKIVGADGTPGADPLAGRRVFVLDGDRETVTLPAAVLTPAEAAEAERQRAEDRKRERRERKHRWREAEARLARGETTGADLAVLGNGGTAYYRAALRRIAERIEGAREGERRETAKREFMAAARIVRAGGADESDARWRVLEAAERAGLSADDNLNDLWAWAVAHADPHPGPPGAGARSSRDPALGELPAPEPIASAGEKLRALLRQRIAGADSETVNLLAASPGGVGKTRAAYGVISELHHAGELPPLVYAAPTHGLLDAAEHELTARGVARWRYVGPGAALAEDVSDPNSERTPVCAFAGAVKAWGAPPWLKGAMCAGCEHEPDCRAWEDAPSDVPVILATHAAAIGGPTGGPLQKAMRKRVLVLDESPPPTSKATITAVQASFAVGALYGSAAERDGRGDLIRRGARVLCALLTAGGESSAQADAERYERTWSGSALRDLAHSAGLGEPECEQLAALGRLKASAHDNADRFPMPPPRRLRDGADDAALTPRPELAEAAGELARVLSGDDADGVNVTLACRAGGVGQAQLEVRWRVPLPASRGCIVLDATGATTFAATRATAGGRETVVDELRFADAHPEAVLRLRRQTGSFSRRRIQSGHLAVLPPGEQRARVMARVERVLALVLARAAEHLGRAPDPNEVGVLTHAPLARELHEAHPGWRVGWYGAHDRGTNKFEGVCLLVTLGDPFPNIGAARRTAHALGLSEREAESWGERMAAATLDQAIWRARTVRAPARVVVAHVGRLMPPSWDGCAVERLRDRNDPGDPEADTAPLAVMRRELSEFGVCAGLGIRFAPHRVFLWGANPFTGRFSKGRAARLRAALRADGYREYPTPPDLLAPGRGPRPQFWAAAALSHEAAVARLRALLAPAAAPRESPARRRNAPAPAPPPTHEAPPPAPEPAPWPACWGAPSDWTEDERETLDERAAVRQIDGGLSRAEAERLARLDVTRLFSRA